MTDTIECAHAGADLYTGQTVEMDPAKDEAVLSVLRRLRQDLGDDAFVIEDHWQSERCAIGIARPKDRRFLVYISTLGPDDSLAFECESPPTEEGQIYSSDGMTDSATYDMLLSAVREHLT